MLEERFSDFAFGALRRPFPLATASPASCDVGDLEDAKPGVDDASSTGAWIEGEDCDVGPTGEICWAGIS